MAREEKHVDYALGDRASAADIAMVEAGSKWADTRRNQKADRSFMHSMRAGKPMVQSAPSAIRARDAHIVRMLDMAQQAAEEGKRAEAMFLFGVAVHAEMDATSSATG